MMSLLQSLYVGFLRISLWKKLGLLGVLIAIALGVLWGIGFFNKQTGYVFDAAQKTSITEIVSDSGKIISDGKVDVFSPTTGIIQELYVANGQKVNEDENLFKVKSSATIQEQQTALANYQAAVAAKNSAETLLHTYRSAMYVQWDTFTDLATKPQYESSKGVPDLKARESAEFQTAQDNWLAAEKQFIDQEQAVTAAQAQVAAAWTTYQATQTSVVLSPIAGIVNNLSVAVGKSVSIPTVTNPNPTPVLTLVNSDKIEAVLAIGQTDIAKIKEGQKVRIHPDSYKDKTFDGKVIRVDALGQDALGVVSYNVYIALTGTNTLLRAGMTIDADVVTNQLKNVLTVPNSAVVLYQGGKAVRILKNNTMVYLPVVVGVKGETRTQILDGLSENQQIISSLTNERAARPSFMGL